MKHRPLFEKEFLVARLSVGSTIRFFASKKKLGEQELFEKPLECLLGTSVPSSPQWRIESHLCPCLALRCFPQTSSKVWKGRVHCGRDFYEAFGFGSVG